jgi:drug/metabolite transporter (DMT)-like permease
MVIGYVIFAEVASWREITGAIIVVICGIFAGKNERTVLR